MIKTDIKFTYTVISKISGGGAYLLYILARGGAYLGQETFLLYKNAKIAQQRGEAYSRGGSYSGGGA